MNHHEAIALALDEGRRKAGLSYSAVVGELRDRLGVFALSTTEGVRNYHRPETFPKKPDLTQILAMADIYLAQGVELSPSAKAALGSVMTLTSKMLDPAA